MGVGGVSGDQACDPVHLADRIVPTLRVGMPHWTLCVRLGTRSVRGCIPTQSVGTISRPQVIFPQTAWGGYKQRGIGRELGPWGLAAFQEIKHVIRAI